MPQYPTRQYPTNPGTRPGAEPPTHRLQPLPATSPAAPAKPPDLSVNKVIAGAGAAATSAILGSYFGAAGTVTGAALGSVASTIATVVYQRSLDRTRDTLVARIRITPGRRTDVAQPVAQTHAVGARAGGAPDARTRAVEPRIALPAPRVAPDAETVRLQVEPAIRPRPRHHWRWVVATVLVFAIGMLAVTGIEWAKGSTLTTGQSGTSVGRVLDPGRDRPSPPADEQDTTPTPTPSDSAEPTPEPTDEPTEESSPTDSSGPDATDNPDPSGIPGFGDDGRSDAESGNGGSVNSTPTPLLPVPLGR